VVHPEASENEATFFVDVDGTPENVAKSYRARLRW
jgi:hypothetical protein